MYISLFYFFGQTYHRIWTFSLSDRCLSPYLSLIVWVPLSWESNSRIGLLSSFPSLYRTVFCILGFCFKDNWNLIAISVYGTKYEGKPSPLLPGSFFIGFEMSSILQRAERRARDNIQSGVKMEQDTWGRGNCSSYILYGIFTGIC